MPIRSRLYEGRVTHQRLQPFRYKLGYKVYAWLIDLDEAAALDTGSLWFGYNRRALLSFNERDHGARDGTPLLPWIRGVLTAKGLGTAGCRVAILCFPRVLGYAFNPISLYFCYDAEERLAAVLYEVKNTFGEQHCYLFPITTPQADIHEHACTKEFYVSPFIEMAATYNFRLTPPAGRFTLEIRQYLPAGEILRAVWGGIEQSWSDTNLKRCFFTYPLLSFKIIFAIHWHGLRLWLKKARFHHRPALPADSVSLIEPEQP